MSENKTVLITGGSRGIGEQVAYEFSRHGFTVIITFVSQQNKAEIVVGNCLKLGAEQAFSFPLDLRQTQSIKELTSICKKQFSHLDVLINNAAVIGKGPVHELSVDQIESQIRVNLEGLIKLTSILLPTIKKSIINVGSALAFNPRPNLTVYSATKYAVRGFTGALAKELNDVKVYTVHPGLTATDMGSDKGVTIQRVGFIIYALAVTSWFDIICTAQSDD